MLGSGVEMILEPSIEYLREEALRLPAKRARSVELSNAADSEFPVPIPVGLALRPYQNAAVEFMELHNGRVLMADEMGTGKAQPNFEHVLTPEGWKRIGVIKRGDYVFGAGGKPTKVTAVFPQGLREIFKVTFSDSTNAYCDIEHLWAVNTPLRKWQGYKGWVLTLKQIIDRGLKQSNGNNRFFIPITAPIEFPEREVLLPPYMLGVLLGDGGIKHGVMLSSADLELVEHIRSLLPPGHKITHSSKYDYRIVKQLGISKRNLIRDNLKKLHLFGLGSEDKFIPDCYKFNTIQVRLETLQGLLDTDAYVEPGGNSIEYCSVSRQLADDVMFLVQSLGGTATITLKKDDGIHRTAYRVFISLPPAIKPFSLSRKANAYKPKTKYLPARAIIKVESIGQYEATCIAVEAEDQLYLTANCIVTHNTIQILAWLNLRPDIKRILVVCKAIGKKNWNNEIDKWILGEKIVRRANSNDSIDWVKSLQQYEGRVFLIINYDILSRYVAVINEYFCPDFIVYDECHALKNWKALRTAAAMSIAKGVTSITCATGTPIYNRPIDIWKIIHLLDPITFPDKNTFIACYFDAEEASGFFGIEPAKLKLKDPERLHTDLVESCMIRRLKSQVMKHLPPKIRTVIPLETDPKNRAEVKLAEKELVKALKRKRHKDAMAVLSTGGGNAKAETFHWIATIGIAKAPAAAEFIEDTLEQIEGKVVVFTRHHAVIDYLAGRFPDALKIDGRTPRDTGTKTPRADIIQEFQTNPDKRVFLGSIEACGDTITLTAASTVIFVEQYYSPFIMKQAEDRCHREGQTRCVNVYTLVLDDSLDVAIGKQLIAKQEDADQILDYGTEQSEESLVFALLEQEPIDDEIC